MLNNKNIVPGKIRNITVEENLTDGIYKDFNHDISIHRNASSHN